MPNFAIATIFSAKDRVTQKFVKMGNAADKFGDKSSRAFRKASRSGRGFGDVMKGVLAAGVVQKGFFYLSQGMKSFVSEAAKVENAITDFGTLTGSVDNARKIVNDLNATAAATPFEFGTLSQATKTLLGFEAATQKDLIPTLRMLGDTAGGNAERFQGIILAFSQIKAAGKANMIDVNQLINNGVPILGALAKQWGVTVGEAREMISTGKATGKEITKAFRNMTAEGGKFYKGMENASLTLTGRTSTLTDNLKQTAATIGGLMLPVLKKIVDRGIEIAVAVRGWVDANQDLIKGKAIGYFNQMKDIFNALQPYFPAILTFMGSYLAITKALTIAQAAYNAVMLLNPVGLIVAGIALLITGAVMLIKHWDPVKKWFLDFFDKIKAGIDKISIRGIAGKVGRFFGIGGDETPSVAPRVPPNQTEVEARRQINFQGQLNIAGAPPGSTVEGKTTGAPPLQMELLGANP